MALRGVWELISDSLLADKEAVLLVVVENTSGSPGRAGFKMVLNQEGESAGTIGGGIMEHQLLKKAESMLQGKGRKVSLMPQVHRKNSQDPSGMICAGAQLVALARLVPGDHCELPEKISTFSDFSCPFTIILNQDGLHLRSSDDRAEPGSFNYCSEQEWQWSERPGPALDCAVIGGGHVGFALCKVLSLLDCRITVFDHRPELPQVVHNSFAHRIVTGPYEDAGSYIREGVDSFAVVVSASFHSDEAALTGLLPLRLGYLGLMGSSAKKKQILKNLRDKGF